MTFFQSLRYFCKSFRLYWREYVQFRKLWKKNPERLRALTAVGKRMPSRIEYAYAYASARFKNRAHAFDDACEM